MSLVVGMGAEVLEIPESPVGRAGADAFTAWANACKETGI